MSCLVEYDSDGKIVSSLTGPKTLLRVAAQDLLNSYVIVENTCTDIGYYVRDGVVTAKGDQPSEAHVFNYTSGTWELDLAVAKASKWNEIKSARNDEEFGTFDSLGYTFQSDEVSQRRLQGAVQLSQMDATLVMDWTLADNTVQSFTAAEYIQIGIDLAAHVNAAHIKSRQLRTQIDAATTEAEVNAVIW